MRKILKLPDFGGKEPMFLMKQFVIALVVILLAFGTLFYVLHHQQLTYDDRINQITNSTLSPEQEAVMTKTYDDKQAMSQNNFDVLLPIISGLISGVVAFYFGMQYGKKSDNASKAD